MLTNQHKILGASALLAVAAVVLAWNYWPDKRETAPGGENVTLVCLKCSRASQVPWAQLAPFVKARTPRADMTAPCPACGAQANISMPPGG